MQWRAGERPTPVKRETREGGRTKVPKDLLIKQIPTLEVGWSRLETHSWSLTLAVTLALGSARERFTAPAPAFTGWGRPS